MKFLKHIYPYLICGAILTPNVLVVAYGIESFPYTCAPMFGHYIDEDTPLYLLKFEGDDGSGQTELLSYYGKNEITFVRHFFSKVYGAAGDITPYTQRLSDSPQDFKDRIEEFFDHYLHYLEETHNLRPRRINILVKQVDRDRNDLTDFELLGSYDSLEKKYYSSRELAP